MVKLLKLSETKIDTPFKSWKFPGGEVGVQLLSIKASSSYEIFIEYESSDDIFAMLNLVDALRNSNIQDKHIFITIPYLPYARQDRYCNAGESFALKVFISVLKSIGENIEIEFWDVHSDVAIQLMYESGLSFFNKNQFVCAKNLPKFDYLIAPDKGAATKASQHGQIADGTNLVCLTKTRLFDRIVYTEHEYDTIKGSVCVVDDLSDGNGTFVALGEMLKRTQPNITSLNLYVTHGLFSKGVSNLDGLYDKIYTHNLMNKSLINKVTVI